MAAEPSTNRILPAMLDRLYAAMASGPALNCRPGSSRQRIDLSTLERLRDVPPETVLEELLSERAKISIVGKVPVPPQRAVRSKSANTAERATEDDEPIELKQQRRAYTEQQSLLGKLRILADESLSYQQDTGAHVLYIGYPLLSIPAAGGRAAARFGGRQVLAPMTFIPVDLTIRANMGAGIDIRCREDGVDRVIANESLLAWVERQTGREVPDFFSDEDGEDPHREIRSICEFIAKSFELELPAFLAEPEPNSSTEKIFPVTPVPKDLEQDKPSVLPCAVLGLFPASKQGLIRDTKAMMAAGTSAALAGPVKRFLSATPRGDGAVHEPHSPAAHPGALPPAERRLVTRADPCQARAVALAREHDTLVIHGPPGTGKSQTITNIIADHLARGERILFVCDKRTALDVVANRLAHMGLGSLCALVHDAQRDQRDLYRSIREQMESLADTKVPAATERLLVDADAEISRIHAELTELRTAIMGTTGHDASINTLVGRWLDTTIKCAEQQPPLTTLEPALLNGATIRELEAQTIAIQSMLRHAQVCEYAENPWAGAVGVTLPQFLSLPMEKVRSGLAAAVTAAEKCDATMHPAIPPFSPTETLETQANNRQRVLDELTRLLDQDDAAIRKHWAACDATTIGRSSKSLAEVADHIRRLESSSLDPQFLLLIRDNVPQPSQIAASIATLDAYLASADTWHAFLHFGARAAAAKVLKPYGLALSTDSAQRAKAFLSGLLAALVVQSVLDTFSGSTSKGLPDAAAVAKTARAHEQALALLQFVHQHESLRPLHSDTTRLLGSVNKNDALADPFIEGLRRSGPRATAVAALEESLRATGLFADDALSRMSKSLRIGRSGSETITDLSQRIGTIESVLRVREGTKLLPGSLRPAIEHLLKSLVDPALCLLVLRQGVLACETRGRIEQAPAIAALDPLRVQTLFDRWRELEQTKHTLVRDSVLAHWISKQRGRLLVSTGSRLNGDGAELRRRVSSRGAHALRLRQVLELGRGAPGGDPLLDLRPVWMASPETVAQVFPRENTFDIVVFDEASQCRLEEALPVLMRGKRVVIAGDPKQLPPSRFFEDTSLTDSEGGDVENDQDLFEQQQADVEDLLSASLNLDIQQTYLDVHYRSRNADLIAFSNEQFYGSRLQPIPGHPANRTRYAPLTLYTINGVYENRQNIIEADRVVKIIHGLLRRAEPPSIGVGCFNIAQRDLIVERLDDAAASDPWFAGALAAARVRQGEGSFEGLFVKNLENVQGDERDHIIISTTYGPDPSGRFYRRFGPLGMAGGGRRLNVLVTRARCEVHLVSSIPPAVYRSLPPVEQGQVPGGGWLLFSYLNYAERLARLYEQAHQDRNPAAAASLDKESSCIDDTCETDPDGSSEAVEADHEEVAECGQVDRTPAPALHIRETRYPSELAPSLGKALVRQTGVGGTAHWGNDGFCIDTALDHPTRPDDVTIGVLTDFSRFDLASDPIEWDIFSTAILEGQGWTLHRVWSPMLFRDLDGVLQHIARQADIEARKPRKDPLD